MIQLTRINHIPMVLNSELIEHIETTPDTVISLTNGQKFVVLEPASEVTRKVIEYKRKIYRPGAWVDRHEEHGEGDTSHSRKNGAER